MYQHSQVHDQELSTIWSQLSTCYQLLNRNSSPAEQQRIRALMEMLRIEYRMLTSTYTTSK